MSLQKITDGLKEKIGDDCGLGAVVKFDFGDQGSVVMDTAQVPNQVGESGAEPDCTIAIGMDDFMAMADGSLDAVSAFMTGRLKVQGDMGIAMKLGSILN